MKIAIIHISDIHLTGENENVRERLERLPRVVAATQTDIAGVIVAISGDIANTGGSSEFKVAEKYLKILIDKIKDNIHGVEVHVLCVPGNHDCDFSNSQGARNGLIKHLRSCEDTNIDESIIEVCCEPQNNYFTFANSISTPPPNYHSRLYFTYNLSVGNFNIAVQCFNTAWISQMQDQKGSLFYPVSTTKGAKSLSADYVISMFHHPYGWLPSNNYKRLSEIVEKTSDLALTGHEHEGERFLKSTPEGNSNLYLEGEVFNAKDVPGQCGFNVVYVDLASQQQRIYSFHWGEKSFSTTTHSPDWTGYSRGFRAGRDFELKESYINFLEDPEAALIHPTKTSLKLSDIFIIPNFREQKISSKSGGALKSHIRGAELINTILTTANKSLFYAKQDAGKTTFAKYLYTRAYNAKLTPVLIHGDDISSNPDVARIDALVEKAIAEQYYNAPQPALPTIDKDKIFLIIDDFDKSNLNAKGRLKLLGALELRYDRICILGDDLLKVQELTVSAKTDTSINKYQHFDLLEFGYKLRNELIEKWYEIGVEYSSNPNEIEQKVAAAETLVNGLLGKSFLPSYPIYILMFLQSIESANGANTSAVGTYGSLYEVLITQELAACKSKALNIDTKRTYLSELAFSVFSHGHSRFSDEDWVKFHADYRSKFRLSYEKALFVDDLTNAGIIQKRDEVYCFKHPYAYYYFVARYLKDNLHKEEIRNVVKSLCSQFYNEKHSSIWLFLTHLSKDPFVIDSLLEHAARVFDGIPAARFDDDIIFLKEMGESVPKIILKDLDAREEKKKRLEHLDREVYENELVENKAPESEVEDVKDETSESLFKELQIASRTLQILGQVIKNFPGSLEGNDKLRLVKNAYELGLRTTEHLLSKVRLNSETLIQEIVSNVREKHPELQAKYDVENAVRRFLFWLVETLCFSTIKNISRSVGHRDLAETYEEISTGQESNAYKLIRVSIELDTHGVKETALKNYALLFKDNIFCKRLLQQLYSHHAYIFPIKDKMKQVICSELDIELQSSGVSNLALPGGQRLPSEN